MGAVKRMYMDRCEEWASILNSYYDINTTADEILSHVFKNKEFADEIEQQSYTDTCARESMLNAISSERIGMAYPTYGDSEEYKQEFKNSMANFNKQNI